MQMSIAQMEILADPASPTTESTTPTPTPTDGILLDTANRTSPVPDGSITYPDSAGTCTTGNSSRAEKENGHRGPGAIRARHHNHALSHTAVNEADRRSEASSEQTRVSKFKVVKLESKAPYCRGRWQCFDFHDRPKEQHKNTSAERISSSDQSSISSVPPAPFAPVLVTDSESHHSLADRRLSSEAPRTVPHSERHVIQTQLSGEVLGKMMDGILRQESSGSTSTLSGASAVPAGGLGLSGDAGVFLSDSNAALSAELSKRTTGDAAASGSGESSGLSLEHKIRQCMDLVGNHLIIAVRGELEHVSNELAKLRDKVEQLEFENNALRSENAILRYAAGSDIPSRAVPSRKK